MSRRRYISTDISTDCDVNKLSDFAALLFTWILPHIADDCRLTPKNAEEVLWTVVPARKKTIKQVQTALDEIISGGLMGKDENGRFFIPDESFYKYQTYIAADKRRKTPQIAASPSPSPSLSLSPSIKEDSPPNGGGDRFLIFWKIYPKKVGKGEAERVWKKIHFENGLFEHVLTAVEAHKASAQWAEEGGRFIPHPATWLGQKRWDDVVSAAPAAEESLEEYMARMEAEGRKPKWA